MKIIMINRYFWPEKLLVNDIAAWLAEEHEVIVYCGQLTLKEEKLDVLEKSWKNVRIHRCPLPNLGNFFATKHLNNILFTFFSTFFLLRQKGVDLVWCNSIPPLIQALCFGPVAKLKQAKFVIFCQDIYPELAQYKHGKRRSGPVWSILHWLDKVGYSLATHVVTLSDEMAKIIIGRGKSPDSVAVIRNFSPVPEFDLPMKSPGPGVVKFIVAGTIGRFQGVDRLLSIFGHMDPNSVSLTFMGSGGLVEEMKAVVKKQGFENILFHDPVDFDSAPAIIGTYDVGIVSLAPNISPFAFPSRVHAYLGSGLPIFCLTDEDSELQFLTAKLGIGTFASHNTPNEEIEEKIRDLVDKVPVFRDNIQSNARCLYDRDLAKNAWIDFVNALN